MSPINSTMVSQPGNIIYSFSPDDNARPRMADIRCNRCRRLLFRWEYRGIATIEVKCPRCGTIDAIALSTG